MEKRVHTLRSHQRRSRRGKFHWVCSTLVKRKCEPLGQARLRNCPSCGAKILTRIMPNGGLVHFEGGWGLRRIKHPCLHRGEGLSRRRDDGTLDLFDAPEDITSPRKFKRGR